VHGRGVGILISMAAAYIAGEAQAQMEANRFTQGFSADSAYIEKEVAQKLADQSDAFMRHYALSPDMPLYANVTINVRTFEGYVVAYDDVITWSDYEGTWLDSVNLSIMPSNGERLEINGSAAQGGSYHDRYITYAVPLQAPAVEDVAAYARLSGMNAAVLRAYAKDKQTEAGRNADAGVGPKQAAYWGDIVALLDASDAELVLRAHTDRIDAGAVRGLLQGKAEAAEKAITYGAHDRMPGTVGKLAQQAADARELDALLDAPFEDVVEYAAAHGMNLGALRLYAANRLSQTGLGGDAGAGASASAYWSQMLRYIDSF
jgi:hypothetical protein